MKNTQVKKCVKSVLDVVLKVDANTASSCFAIVYIALIMTLAILSAVKVYAGDHNFNYSFSFDGTGTRYTAMEAKTTNHAVTMYCTDGENISSYAYYAKVCSSFGKSTDYQRFNIGTFRAYYGACGYSGGTVYFSAYLGGDDVDSFYGTWNPDDPRY